MSAPPDGPEVDLPEPGPSGARYELEPENELRTEEPWLAPKELPVAIELLRVPLLAEAEAGSEDQLPPVDEPAFCGSPPVPPVQNGVTGQPAATPFQGCVLDQVLAGAGSMFTNRASRSVRSGSTVPKATTWSPVRPASVVPLGA